MKKHLCQLFAFAAIFVFLTQTAFARTDAAAQKEWTFLVYINGHNSLDTYGKMNINSMEKVGSSQDVNVVVQWASNIEKTVRRLYIEKDSSAEVTSPVLQDLGNIDMGDYRQLTDFIKWGAENYPAKKYFVAVWNHGNGWNLMNASGGMIKPQDISYDDNFGSKITTEQLGVVMGDAAKLIGHNVDVYGSDACLMAMAEVATEMGTSVNYFVGSQEVEPGEGWPYETFLQRWEANGTASGAEVSSFLTEEYQKAYSGGIYGKQDVTFSALDLAQLGNLNAAISNLVKELKNQDAAGIASLKATANKAQSFARSDYKDLSNLLDLVAKNSKVKVQKQTITDVKTALSSLIIANKTSSHYKKAKGLSIWSPEYSFDYDDSAQRYQGLEFNRQTGWNDVLHLIAD